MTIKLSQIDLRWDILQKPTMMTVGSHLGDSHTSPFRVMYSRDKLPHCIWSGNQGSHLCCINCSWICYKLHVCAKQKTITAAHVSMCYNCYGHIFWSNIHCFKESKQFNKKNDFFPLYTSRDPPLANKINIFVWLYSKQPQTIPWYLIIGYLSILSHFIEHLITFKMSLLKRNALYTASINRS